MTFNIDLPIFDRTEEQIIAYQDELLKRFAASPEGQAILDSEGVD